MPETEKKEGTENNPKMIEMLEMPVYSEREFQSPIMKAWVYIGSAFDGPVTWVRENVVERYRKNRPKHYYYHQKFNRVTPIYDCYADDLACIYEADMEYKRDKRVDEHIVNILRNRYFNCIYYNRNVNEYLRNDDLCVKEKADFKDAELNSFIKHGDLGPYGTVIDAYMKQKHRLIWERRQTEKNDNANN